MPKLEKYFLWANTLSDFGRCEEPVIFVGYGPAKNGAPYQTAFYANPWGSKPFLVFVWLKPEDRGDLQANVYIDQNRDGNADRVLLNVDVGKAISPEDVCRFAPAF
jgi:hypothetical protein